MAKPAMTLFLISLSASSAGFLDLVSTLVVCWVSGGQDRCPPVFLTLEEKCQTIFALTASSPKDESPLPFDG